MFEIEQKYRVEDCLSVIALLEQSGLDLKSRERQTDTYLRHPQRDFAKSGEALRIREVTIASAKTDWLDEHELLVTYKGKRAAGEVKIRQEIELPLGGDKAEWMILWDRLGFTIADSVHKLRQSFAVPGKSDITIAVDEVEQLGSFVEIEVLADDSADQQLVANRIITLARQLSLEKLEPRSYLRQLLELKSSHRL